MSESLVLEVHFSGFLPLFMQIPPRRTSADSVTYLIRGWVSKIFSREQKARVNIRNWRV